MVRRGGRGRERRGVGRGEGVLLLALLGGGGRCRFGIEGSSRRNGRGKGRGMRRGLVNSATLFQLAAAFAV